MEIVLCNMRYAIVYLCIGVLFVVVLSFTVQSVSYEDVEPTYTSTVQDDILLSNSSDIEAINDEYLIAVSRTSSAAAIINIKDRNNPYIEFSFTDPILADARFVEVKEGRAYISTVGATHYLVILDITDLSNISLVNSYDTLALYNVRTFDFEIHDNYLYSSTRSDDPVEDDYCFSIYDIGEPDEIDFMTSPTLPGEICRGVLDVTYDPIKENIYAYSTTGDVTEEIIAFNVSDKNNPVYLDNFAPGLPQRNCQEIHFYKDRVICGGFISDNLTIFNVEDPTNIFIDKDIFDTTNFDGAGYVQIVDDYLFLIGFFGNTLTTFDFSDVSDPVRIDTIQDNVELNFPYSFLAYEGYLYIPARNSNSVSIWKVDHESPTLSNFRINHGVSYTNDNQVSLSYSHTEEVTSAKYIYISEDNFNTSVKLPFVPNKYNFGLNSNDGSKQVQIRIEDEAGNLSSIKKASITLDTQKPTGSVVLKSVTSKQAKMEFTTSDNLSGVKEIIISNNQNFTDKEVLSISNSLSWDLPDPEGENIIYIKFVDHAGNESKTYTVTATGEKKVSESKDDVAKENDSVDQITDANNEVIEYPFYYYAQTYTTPTADLEQEEDQSLANEQDDESMNRPLTTPQDVRELKIEEDKSNDINQFNESNGNTSLEDPETDLVDIIKNNLGLVISVATISLTMGGAVLYTKFFKS